MLDLVENPKDMFSRNAAQIKQYLFRDNSSLSISVFDMGEMYIYEIFQLDWFTTHGTPNFLILAKVLIHVNTKIGQNFRFKSLKPAVYPAYKY